MGWKQREHNLGQKDGSKANTFDELVENFNPFTSPHRRKGFKHGRQQQSYDLFAINKDVQRTLKGHDRKHNQRQRKRHDSSHSEWAYSGSTAETGVWSNIVGVVFLLWMFRYGVLLIGVLLLLFVLGPRSKPQPGFDPAMVQQHAKLDAEKSQLERVVAWADPPIVRFRQAVQVLSPAHEWHPATLTVLSDGIQLHTSTRRERWHFKEINRLDLGSGLDNFPVTVYFNRRIGDLPYVQFGVGPSSGPFPRSVDREQHRQLLNRLRVVYESWSHSGRGRQQLVANDRLDDLRDALTTGRSIGAASASVSQEPIALEISEVKITDVTANSANVNWDTSKLADGQVQYCTSFAGCGTNTTVSSKMTITHRVTLSDLSPNQTYFIWVKSRDTSGTLKTEGYFAFGTRPNE